MIAEFESDLIRMRTREVDESKQRNYLLVAAVVMPGDLAGARRALHALVMPGQRLLHMKDCT